MYYVSKEMGIWVDYFGSDSRTRMNEGEWIKYYENTYKHQNYVQFIFWLSFFFFFFVFFLVFLHHNI